jgi:hypothetical protein
VELLSSKMHLAILQAVTLPGDFNFNGVLDAADFVAWRDNYGIQSGAMSSSGDGDRDGDVDGADYLIWQRQFGSFAPAASAKAPIPEPATMVLPMVAATSSCRRHWALYFSNDSHIARCSLPL